MMRSTTSSMLRGWSAGRGAAAAALLPIPLDTSTRIAVASLRISLLSPQLTSVSQPELDAHASGKIHRLAISLGRFKFYLLSCPYRGLIETMAQPADDSVHLDRAVRLEDQVEYHVTLESKITPFRGVLRARFVQNVNHGGRRIARCCFLFRGVIGHAGISKAAALHHTVFAAPARRRIGYAISEASTRDRATDAFAAARTISVPITARQRRRTQPINISSFVGISFA